MAGMGEFDLPFEEQARTDWTPEPDTMLAGAMVVMSTVVGVPNLGAKPGLVFRFVDPAGEFYPAVLLVMEPHQLARVSELIAKAVDTAVRGAS